MAKLIRADQTPSTDGRAVGSPRSTSDHSRGTSADRRGAVRVRLEAAVVVRAPSAKVLFQSRVRDLSETGVFLLSTTTRPVGTVIELSIAVEEAHLRVNAKGIVVHAVPLQESTSDRPAGMGVMFTTVGAADRMMLRSMVAYASGIEPEA